MQTMIINHFPPVIKRIKEIQEIAKAEDIEFTKLRSYMKIGEENTFILTADEEGIAQFENIMGISPTKGEKLEIRRARVLAKWYDIMPFNMKTLRKKMEAICNGRKFEIDVQDGEREASIKVFIEPDVEYMLHEAQKMLEEFIPVNMYYLVTGSVKREKEVRLHAGSTKNLFIKIKADPVNESFHVTKQQSANVRTVTFNHIKITYKQKE